MNTTGKKRKKAAVAGAVLLAVMLTVSACGSTPESTAPGNDSNNSVGAAPTDHLPEGSGIFEPGSLGSNDEDDNESSDNEATDNEATDNEGVGAATDEVIAGQGVYNGQIDSNSIEITTEDGPAAFRITEELASVIESLPTDANVKFEYTEKIVDSETKQLWLTSIEEMQ